MEIPQSVKATSHKDVKNPTDFQSLSGFSYSANWNLSDTITRSEIFSSTYAKNHIGCLRSVTNVICTKACSGKFIFFGIFTADGIKPLISIASVRSKVSYGSCFYPAVKPGVIFLSNGFIGERIEINNDFGVIYITCISIINIVCRNKICFIWISF